ncbi:hypothetical protein PANT_12c00086 [Moesziomyces antarcticus T-34]|uniref:Uncharacterized protein n=1 Tax=Pseudozyma antarctica (strain T-34) TaxID=1151754 RepID=M9MDS4_PSEA3|nr:hypothetical protein PANT_12c00086 [Moesziomyces antarcticus T-34]
MLDHLTPFFALAAAALVLLPLPYHIKSRNVGTLALSIWLFIGNIDGAINSMVWWHSTSNKAAFFCELSNVHRNSRLQSCDRSQAGKHRIHEAGPRDCIRPTEVGDFRTHDYRRCTTRLRGVHDREPNQSVRNPGGGRLLSISEIIMGMGCARRSPCHRGIINFRHLQRRQFQAVLASSASTINQSRYVRLLALTAVDILLFFPIYLGTTAAEIRSAIVKPYGSWSQVHEDFGIIPEYPAVLIEAQGLGPSIIISKIVCPVSGVICFVLFGLGQEARQGYKATVFRALIALKLRKPPKRPTPDLSFPLSRLRPVIADIEAVTFQSRDDCSASHRSPASEKFGVYTPKFGEA